MAFKKCAFQLALQRASASANSGVACATRVDGRAAETAAIIKEQDTVEWDPNAQLVLADQIRAYDELRRRDPSGA